MDKNLYKGYTMFKNVCMLKKEKKMDIDNHRKSKQFTNNKVFKETVK